MTAQEIPQQARQDGADQARADRRRHAPVPGAPWLPRGYLPRRVLWSRLNRSTRHAVTMVVAPAGAGKTLGVAGWVQHSTVGQDAIWLHAEKSVAPRHLESTLARAKGGPGGVPRLVVIDDAHSLPSASVRYLNRRLSDDPDSIRLILLTRWDLAISRLVPELLGHLTVLRGDILKLSDDETARLVAEHARTDSEDICQAIAARAEGWCAAVVLAARAGAAAPSRAEFIRRCQEAGPGVADLVAGEVFAALRSRERHLLLCTAAEPVLTGETARHLTRDPSAGDVLATLESTGLLVIRVADSEPDDEDSTRVRFRIHPLLLEVARRRLIAGGVDVQQAHGTVLRAARLDLARGDTADGFRRLVSLGEYDEAAAVLAEHGPRLVGNGNPHVDAFVRQADSVVDAHPETWPAIAWARRLAGDEDGAQHWVDRVLREATAHPGSVTPVQVATVRLQKARRGLGSVRDAVVEARTVLDPEQPLPVRDSFLSVLLLELGVAENWLGDLDEAEQHLSEAVLLSRAERLESTTVEALTHLALTRFMSGRESACHDLAQEVVTGLEPETTVRLATIGRAQLALHLARLHALPWPARALPEFELPPVPDDLAGRFWHRLLDSKRLLLGGDVADAQRRLEPPFELPELPVHLRVNLLMDQAVLALITGNRPALRATAQLLHDLDAAGEQRWTEAVLADLDGDLRAAAAGYVEASESECRVQPATRALSLVCAAQLYDYLGDGPRSRALLGQAVTATESRRNAGPFLGWSPHGTRVGLLFDKSPASTASAWADELRAACADRPGVTSTFRPLVATAGELRSVVDPMVSPALSPREQEVLGELARGSTYSDIAANLFVSENTVKTHISSLYSKLAVGRRSEALAIARKLHLL